MNWRVWEKWHICEFTQITNYNLHNTKPLSSFRRGMRTATRLGYYKSGRVYAIENKEFFVVEQRFDLLLALVEGVAPTNKYYENCGKVEKLGVCNW